MTRLHTTSPGTTPPLPVIIDHGMRTQPSNPLGMGTEELPHLVVSQVLEPLASRKASPLPTSGQDLVSVDSPLMHRLSLMSVVSMPLRPLGILT